MATAAPHARSRKEPPSGQGVSSGRQGGAATRYPWPPNAMHPKVHRPNNCRTQARHTHTQGGGQPPAAPSHWSRLRVSVPAAAANAHADNVHMARFLTAGEGAATSHCCSSSPPGTVSARPRPDAQAESPPPPEEAASEAVPAPEPPMSWTAGPWGRRRGRARVPEQPAACGCGGAGAGLWPGANKPSAGLWRRRRGRATVASEENRRRNRHRRRDHAAKVPRHAARRPGADGGGDRCPEGKQPQSRCQVCHPAACQSACARPQCARTHAHARTRTSTCSHTHACAHISCAATGPVVHHRRTTPRAHGRVARARRRPPGCRAASAAPCPPQSRRATRRSGRAWR